MRQCGDEMVCMSVDPNTDIKIVCGISFGVTGFCFKQKVTAEQ
jgi:hypothetical protein